MTADIFGARFYGYRQPAWHGLGQVSADRVGAVEAFERLGPYEVLLERIDSESLEIVRLPTADDATRRSFGQVDPGYVLVPPAELTALWDRHTGQPIETLGALQRGQCLFLTMRLNTREVRGDPVANYLVLAHWMSAHRTSAVFLTPVRVVCSNTLRFAEHRARVRIDLAPTVGLRERIAEQLPLAIRGAHMRSFSLHSQFELMAGRRLTTAEAASVAAAAYPDDSSLRQAALDLFDGAGRGMDHPAARGTVWGLYNAIAELENFREGDTDAQVASDVLFGSRAIAMGTAFEAGLALARGHNPPPVAPSPPLHGHAAPTRAGFAMVGNG